MWDQELREEWMSKCSEQTEWKQEWLSWIQFATDDARIDFLKKKIPQIQLQEQMLMMLDAGDPSVMCVKPESPIKTQRQQLKDLNKDLDASKECMLAFGARVTALESQMSQIEARLLSLETL